MRRPNLHDETGRALVTVLLVIVLGALCGAVLAATRYVLCPAPGGTAVYKMDRFTGKVWVLTGDRISALQERREGTGLDPESGPRMAPGDEKPSMIRWVREAVDFDEVYRPKLAAAPYDLDILGWEVYRLTEGQLLPCPSDGLRDAAGDKCVIGYTLRITHPQKGKLECGWYWEACPADSLISPINGNPVLESSYGLEDRTDPDVLALLEPPSPAPAKVVPDGKQRAERLPYVASKGRANFHVRTCRWAKEIPREQLLEFGTLEEAKASGRRPCGVCAPR